MSGTQSELRLARLIDEREQTHKLHEGKLEDLADSRPNEADENQLVMYREQMTSLDKEISDLTITVEAHNQRRRAVEEDPARPRRRRRRRGGRRRGRLPDDGVVCPRRHHHRQRPRSLEDQRHPRRQAGDRPGRVAGSSC